MRSERRCDKLLNPNSQIKQALEGDSSLAGKVGKAVYQDYPTDDIPPPFVVFDVSNNRPCFAADDAEYASEISVTIDAVHRKNSVLTAIFMDVDRILAGVGYVRTHYGPLMLIGGSYTRMVRYKTEVEVE